MVGAWQGVAFQEVSLKQLANDIDLQLLTSRRDLYDAVFLHKIINYGIDSLELFGKVSFRCFPVTLRGLFWRRFSRTNY